MAPPGWYPWRTAPLITLLGSIIILMTSSYDCNQSCVESLKFKSRVTRKKVDLVKFFPHSIFFDNKTLVHHIVFIFCFFTGTLQISKQDFILQTWKRGTLYLPRYDDLIHSNEHFEVFQKVSGIGKLDYSRKAAFTHSGKFTTITYT